MLWADNERLSGEDRQTGEMVIFMITFLGFTATLCIDFEEDMVLEGLV